MAQGFVHYVYKGTCQTLKGRKLGNLLAAMEKQGGVVVMTNDGYTVTMPDGGMHEFFLA